MWTKSKNTLIGFLLSGLFLLPFPLPSLASSALALNGTQAAEQNTSISMSINQWQMLKQELSKQNLELDQLRKKLTMLNSTSSEQRQSLEQLQSELNETEKNLQNASSSLTACQNALKESEKSLETLKQEIKELEHKQKVLRRQRDVWAGAFMTLAMYTLTHD